MGEKTKDGCTYVVRSDNSASWQSEFEYTNLTKAIEVFNLLHGRVKIVQKKDGKEFPTAYTKEQ